MKDKIIQSAMQQILKFGFRKFTIENIASDLGISKKTVYKYFESKNQIISQVIETHVELEKTRILRAMQTEGGWIEKFKELIYKETREKAPDWLVEELQQYFPEEWEKPCALEEYKRQQLSKLLKKGIETGDIRPNINPAIIDLALCKTIEGVFNFSFLKEHNLSLNEAIEEIEKLFLFGIMKRIS